MPVINDTQSVNASSNTLQSMVDECRDSYLYMGSTPLLNQLASPQGTSTLTSIIPAGGVTTANATAILGAPTTPAIPLIWLQRDVQRYG